MLESIKIPSSVMERPVPEQVLQWTRDAWARVRSFQDRWDRDSIEQFVASDYDLVFQTLEWIKEHHFCDGSRFLEWGCGFSVVCALASYLGWDAVGIEAESELLARGRETVEDWGLPVELVHGNFLPRGAERLSDDPTLPSLGHPVGAAYESLGLEIDDFAMIFSYPWPGEEDFHCDVFERHARPGALLLQYCGPYDLRLWRRGKR